MIVSMLMEEMPLGVKAALEARPKYFIALACFSADDNKAS
jgi:hypothetical protein